MAIQGYGRGRNLSGGLQDVLRKNGMQAHLSVTPEGRYQLLVLGHDSPALAYDINERQAQALMDWGSNSANKKAYNTFAGIVRNDFSLPDSFAAARNAFGRVAMGLHGYRLGAGEYGCHRRGMPFFSPFGRYGRGWGGDFVGWAPRTMGFHLRREGGRLVNPYGPMVQERPDARLKPGELRSGGYGFYYKGNRQDTSVDVLDRLAIDAKIKPLEAAPRPEGQGLRYSEEITSGVYFSNDKLQNVLASHGIVIDAGKKTLTVQSALTKVDLQYDLKTDELEKLTASALEGKDGVSLNERLGIINNILIKDFSTPLTKDMLETKDLVRLDLRPEVRAEVEAPFIEQERRMAAQQRMAEERARVQEEKDRIRRDPHAVNGMEIQAILGNRGWYQPVEHGREMVVGEIRVDRNAAGTCVMTAEVNGRLLAHTISGKDYNRFLDLDDEHRLKMFDNVFREVEIKSAHGQELYADKIYAVRDGRTIVHQREMDVAQATTNKVDGAALQEMSMKKGFYRERAHGREVEVGNIQVDRMEEGKYRMTAVINGKPVSHEITQKQYDKFLAVDDYQRMKLFSKVFDEVDLKTRPGQGTDIGAAILAALVVSGEVAADVMDMRKRPRPEVYETKAAQPSGVYYKRGAISPEEVAAARFRDIEATLDDPRQDNMRRGL